MLDRFPKNVVIGAVVVVVLLAAFIVFRTATGGERAAYGSKQQIQDMQKKGQQNGGHTQTDGH